MEGHLSSAAAFVDGGAQDPLDDACSICLESFCDSDPSTVTSCKHEFHLQCILEWCQRNSKCPMCWQSIILKDPASQELLEAIEKERGIRLNQTRSSTFFHHSALGDFELQHLPVGAAENELEESIIQHLAAAASMSRAQHMARRERLLSAAHMRGQLLYLSTNPNAPPMSSVSASSPQRVEDEPALRRTVEEVPPLTLSQAQQVTDISSGSNIANRSPFFNSRVSPGQSTPVGQDRAGPSDFQSFSESLKSRLSTVSTRYKETITKNTRGWKERLFSRNTSMADIGSEVKREVSAGIASVSRMMERLDTRENRRNGDGSNVLERVAEDRRGTLASASSAPTSHAATSN